LAQQRLDTAVQLLPEFRDPDLSGRPVQQPVAESILQAGKRKTDRRLWNAGQIAGAGKTPGLDNPAEVLPIVPVRSFIRSSLLHPLYATRAALLVDTPPRISPVRHLMNGTKAEPALAAHQ